MKSPLIFALPLLLFSCKKPPATAPMQMPPSAVGVVTIKPEPFVEWEEFSSRVEAMESVQLSPRVSGYLDEVLFQSGQVVKKDAVLFQIDPLPYQARQAQTKALVAQAEAALSSAKTEWERVPQLLVARAMTAEEADARQSAFLQAEAAHAAALAQDQAAQLDLDRTKVRAPIDGKISRALITAGNQVTPASTLTSIVSMDPMFAYADIDENTLLRAQALISGKKVTLDAEGRIPVELKLGDETEFTHKGWFESLDNRVMAGTGSIVLRAIIPNPEGKLVPGMFARIRLPLSEKQATILVEETAIKTDQGQKFVYVIDEKSLAQYRPVVLGPSVQGKRIIRSGLKEGDVVVVNGLAKIFMPGMPVVPEPATASEKQ